MYKRTKHTRIYWVQRGFGAILDGVITLATLGWYDSDFSMKVCEKTITRGIRRTKSGETLY